ncbi:MAG: hypothetical protein AB7O78_03495 [Thermoleophilia bacterium]
MRGRWWILAAAVIVAAVVATPVLGGPSLGGQIASLTAREKKLDKRVDALAKQPLRRGPAGPAGATGPKGDTGPRGPTGDPPPLDAQNGFTASGSIGVTATPVMTATIGHDGDHLVDANLIVVNGAASAVTVTCDLIANPGAEFIDTASVRLAASGGIDTDTLWLSGGVSAAGAGSVRVDCDASASGVTFADADIIALG